jgi:hypothetical protein
MGRMRWFHGRFPVFPDGLPAIGLLLLRITATAAAARYAWLCIEYGTTLRPEAFALVIMAAAVLLAVGLMTPVASLLITGCGAAIAASWIRCPVPFDVTTPAVLTAAIGAALMLIGPGGYSIDARLFGRREIVIPPRPWPDRE